MTNIFLSIYLIVRAPTCQKKLTMHRSNNSEDFLCSKENMVHLAQQETLLHDSTVFVLVLWITSADTLTFQLGF